MCVSLQVNIFILNQSIIDLLGCCAILLYHFTSDLSLVAEGISAELYCRFWISSYILWCLICTSLFNLCAMSLERFFAIHNPLRYDEHKVRKRLPYIIVLVWVLGFNSQYGNLIASKVINGVCYMTVIWPSKMHFTIYACFTNFFNFIIPCVILISSNIVMVFSLRKQAKFSAGNSGQVSKANKTIKDAERNVIHTCMILVSMNPVCSIYNGIIFTMISVGLFDDFHSDLYYMSICCSPVSFVPNAFGTFAVHPAMPKSFAFENDFGMVNHNKPETSVHVYMTYVT